MSEWISASALVRSVLENNPKSDHKTYDRFKAVFDIISKSFIQQPALTRFTKLLVDYMDLESTRAAHEEEFEDAVLEKTLEKAEERARKRSMLRQTQNLNDGLAVEM